ncbi:MAG: hypothetical protein E7487_07140 [Ruminococcaceae bacterium]|nr:hypothetical protein [Oscillospiraceae bacterium]
MEDISKAIGEILGSEEGMKNLRGVAAMLGIDLPGEFADSAVHTDGSTSSNSSDSSDFANGIFGGIDLDTIMKISQLLQKLSCDDDNTRLLKALKPHLKNDKKIDETIKLLRLVSLLPELKQLGLFGGILT